MIKWESSARTRVGLRFKLSSELEDLSRFVSANLCTPFPEWTRWTIFVCLTSRLYLRFQTSLLSSALKAFSVSAVGYDMENEKERCSQLQNVRAPLRLNSSISQRNHKRFRNILFHLLTVEEIFNFTRKKSAFLVELSIRPINFLLRAFVLSSVHLSELPAPARRSQWNYKWLRFAWNIFNENLSRMK